MKFHFQVCGIWISNASGNTFRPAIQFVDGGLLIRTSEWLETKICRRTDGSWYWNSNHIAYCLGKHIEGNEEKGYPDTWEYEGWLGKHYYL
ncbi:hypothetical protein WA1_50805 [Scytonema hofmannii PCC 7110]|uniref:Uncharacterized protein n=1 Tax=Scytonema hofmannii PCC 7110 TaxID=128403 RepID=A0A139WQ11_9CYAN|nr:hypothetical protein [Scytonema hofmannii]KYC34522.1 hypothetical protein WA1_50805 [Scytonema hofmannii PCC 7110]